MALLDQNFFLFFPSTSETSVIAQDTAGRKGGIDKTDEKKKKSCFDSYLKKKNNKGFFIANNLLRVARLD